jgi:hypothetical protein
MLSTMESDAIRQQLADVDRLGAATAAQARRSPPWAWVVLGAGAAVFFATYAIDRPGLEAAAPALWAGFVILWVRWVRHGNRAIPGQAARTTAERRRLVVDGVVVAVAVGAIAVIGVNVSWALGGALLAAVGMASGVLVGRRERRRFA